MRTRSALAATGSVLLFSCGGAATAAHAAGTTLPARGTSFTVAEDGDMVMECDGVLHRFDVHGTAQMRVGRRIAGAPTPTAVVTTEAQQLTGYDADLGTVTVTQRAPAAGSFTAPAVGREFPAAESFAQDLVLAVEHSPCDGGQPAVYAGKAAFPLLNTDLTAFPPRNAVYLLTDPVELDDVTNPSGAPFTLTSFPVTVSRV